MVYKYYKRIFNFKNNLVIITEERGMEVIGKVVLVSW